MGISVKKDTHKLNIVTGSRTNTISIFTPLDSINSVKTVSRIQNIVTNRVNITNNILPGEEVTNPIVITVYATESIIIGNAVYINSIGRLALAGNGIPSIGLSVTSSNANEYSSYISEGKITQLDWSNITGTIELVKGDFYYLANDGKLTNVIPTTGLLQRIGVAVSSSIFDIEMAQPIMLA